MLEGLLLPSFMMPHIFGFLPIIAGALLGMGGAGALGVGALSLGSLGAIGGLGVGALVGGSVGMTIHGAGKSAEAARQQAQLSNDATQRRFWYDTENWHLNKAKIIDDHEYLTTEAKLKAANEQTLANWKDASNAQQYGYQLQIRNARQESNLKQFAKSENIFGQQVTLNAVAAEAGKQDELRSLQEIHTESKFEADEAYLQNLMNEGKLRARGIKGRSIGKVTQATLADYGRQMALISESLSSAGRNTRAVLQQIERDHFSADLAAYAQKMLEPGVEPMPVIPYATPVSEYQLPRALEEHDFGAMPVLGAIANPGAASSAVWGSTISGISGQAVGSVLGSWLTA